jgi:hypothetical protein
LTIKACARAARTGMLLSVSKPLLMLACELKAVYAGTGTGTGTDTNSIASCLTFASVADTAGVTGPGLAPK